MIQLLKDYKISLLMNQVFEQIPPCKGNSDPSKYIAGSEESEFPHLNSPSITFEQVFMYYWDIIQVSS